ncbi:MAG: NADH-quinone oxidoreductase subunit A [Candidatus Odinarchaeota archaeon]
MGIREKYPLPKEEDYVYRTEEDVGNFYIRILQASGIIFVLIVIGVLLFGIFLDPTEPLGFMTSTSDYYAMYAPILLWIALGAVVFIVAVLLNLILMPWNIGKNKHPEGWLGKVPVESGETDVKGTGRVQFGFQYYPFALAFIVFDVVGVFMMLWALMYGDSSISGEPIFFILVIAFFLLGPLAALFFWIKKDKIKWS